ncbi:MAG: hypothetical protein ACYC27_13035 [Armatimonadota bacterium]
MEQDAHGRLLNIFIKIALPVSCALFAVLGVMHICALSMWLAGDWIAGPNAPMVSLDASIFSMPLFALWNGFWMLLAWRSNREWLLQLIGAESILWLSFAFIDSQIILYILIGILVIFAAGTGFFVSLRYKSTDRSVMKTKYGTIFTVVSGAVSIMILYLCMAVPQSSEWSALLVIPWLPIFLLLLGPAFIIGSALPLFLHNDRTQTQRYHSITILLPVTGILLTMLCTIILMNQVRDVRESVVPSFLDYVSSHVVRIPDSYPYQVKINGFKSIDISNHKYIDDSKNKITCYMEVNLPKNWIPEQGLKEPVKLESLVIYNGSENKHDKASREYLDSFLKPLGVSRKVQNSGWKLTPLTKSEIKDRAGYNSIIAIWCADINIDGRKYNLKVDYDTLRIIPFR